MSQITIGEVEWGTVGEERVSDFIVLKEGDNKVRVLTNPTQFASHWVVLDDGSKRKVVCATEGCPVCKRGQDGDKPQARWLIKVLSREDGVVKLLEIGPQVLRGIKDLANSEDWGNPVEYDINIRRGKPNTKPLYSVVPGRRAPLTGDEKAMLAAFNERVDTSRFITATPAAVAEKLGWAVEETGSKTVTNEFRSGNGAKTAPAAKKSNVDFDFDFDSK